MGSQKKSFLYIKGSARSAVVLLELLIATLIFTSVFSIFVLSYRQYLLTSNKRLTSLISITNPLSLYYKIEDLLDAGILRGSFKFNSKKYNFEIEKIDECKVPYFEVYQGFALYKAVIKTSNEQFIWFYLKKENNDEIRN